jgi:hypothetical protein
MRIERGAPPRPIVRLNPPIRRFFSLIATLLILGCVACAQTTSEIAVGTTQEEVVRSHGAPKGRSSAGARESWLYEHFQIVFEKGRVLRVVSLADTKRAELPPGYSARIEPGEAAPVTTVTPPAEAAERVTPHSAIAPRAEARPDDSLPPSFWEKVDVLSPWFWVKAAAAVLVLGAVGLLARRSTLVRRREEEAKAREAARFEIGRKNKAADSQVAARSSLDQTNALTHVATASPHPALTKKKETH